MRLRARKRQGAAIQHLASYRTLPEGPAKNKQNGRQLSAKCDRFRSSCFASQANELVAGTSAIRTFGIAVISGCLTVYTFDPIGCDSNCVSAYAALFTAGFATASVCDSHVVAGATALCATRNWQFSLHLLMIRECWCVHLFHTRRRPKGLAWMRCDETICLGINDISVFRALGCYWRGPE